jgi:magnesium-transporting ATPase (P-type)
MVAQPPEWHSLPIEDALGLVETNSTTGLTQAESAHRLGLYGPNSLPSEKPRSWWQRLVGQFASPLIYVLVAAALITLLLEDYIDSAVIAVVVLANTLIGFIQEGKAQQALEAVRGLLSDNATVIRDGRRHVIDATGLVPGDLVVLESGDTVPADMRLVWAKNVMAIEGSLTGESQPVEKSIDILSSDTVLSERANMLYAGTTVGSGIAHGIVVATSDYTELGKIGSMVTGVGDVKTPLTTRLDHFGVQVTLFILALGALSFGWALYVTNMALAEAFFAVVALAVAAIPEGLPAVVTIALAIATRMMAGKNALIRRLPAVETLGSVSVICTDKTGTLTLNEMTVVRVLLADRTITVEGNGYEPHGSFVDNSGAVECGDDERLLDLGLVAQLCNRAEIRADSSGVWSAAGDPTEAALATLAQKIGFLREELLVSHPLLDEIPFESERRFMATLHARPDGSSMVLVKGAPEKILSLCGSEWDGSQLDVQAWHERMDGAARNGERVLALAIIPRTTAECFIDDQEFPGLVLVGMVGVMDPPRAEAHEAIATCHAAGIRVKMITGDHIVTASAIGEQLGLLVGQPLSGSEIDELDDDQLRQRLEATDIVARANPDHKLRLVGVLQESGLRVAMTGDGVNDAPALKAADIGVAMGRGGTDAAREASDIVLTDDRFETIALAVRRGRVAFDNIKKSLLFILPTSLGESGIILIAIFGGLVLPVTAGQILWINTVTAITLSLALVVERAEPGVMARGPRPAGEPIVTRALGMRILFVGALIIAATFVVFNFEWQRTGDLEAARTAAVAMVVVGEMGYLLQVRRFTQSGLVFPDIRSSGVVIGVIAGLAVLQLAFTYLPFFNLVFDTAPIDSAAWLLIIGLAVAQFFAVEIEKAVWRARGLKAF